MPDPKRICLITHSGYPVEPRSRRLAEALVDAGYAVDVLCLTLPGQPSEAVVGGVRILRLGVTRHQGAGAAVYLQEYASFFVQAGLRLLRLHRAHPYTLVQVHNPPDAMVFCTLPVRLAGVPIILDLRELTPELFMSRFGLARNGFVVRTLALLERWACGYAQAALVLHDRHRRIMLGRGIAPDKLTQVMNCPDERIFDPTRLPSRRVGLAAGQRAADGRFIVINNGGLLERYGVDILVRAVALVRDQIPGIRLELYGAGDFRPRLEALVAELNLGEVVTFHGQQPIEGMPAAIADADVGVAPLRQDVFTDCGLPTKLLEYVALGLPAVASRTATTADYFTDDTVQLFAPGDAEDLARRLLILYNDPLAAQAQADRARRFTEAHNWSIEKASYLSLVRRLVRR
jgi:glycosyltransferase involved in cell wall biosynthesis